MVGTKIVTIQLGKNGITDNFIKNLQDRFQNSKYIKISVLKSAGHDREKIKSYSKEIIEKLNGHFISKTIGFTIVVMKRRKAL